jgi:hypothetical protein
MWQTNNAIKPDQVHAYHNYGCKIAAIKTQEFNKYLCYKTLICHVSCVTCVSNKA